MLRVLIFFQRSAFRRFRSGDAGPWGAVAAGVFGVRMVTKWSARNVDVVYREVLKPGQQVNITHLEQTRADIAKMDRRELKLAKRQVKVTKKDITAAKKAAVVEKRASKAAKKAAKLTKRDGRAVGNH